jgi:hypothetical protein
LIEGSIILEGQWTLRQAGNQFFYKMRDANVERQDTAYGSCSSIETNLYNYQSISVTLQPPCNDIDFIQTFAMVNLLLRYIFHAKKYETTSWCKLMPL